MKRFMIMAVVLLLAAMAWNVTIAEEARHPVVVISEVMASNDSVATYPKAGYTDWIEICNSGDTAVDLGGWGLSDNPEKPRKWQAGRTLRLSRLLRQAVFPESLPSFSPQAHSSAFFASCKAMNAFDSFLHFL